MKSTLAKQINREGGEDYKKEKWENDALNYIIKLIFLKEMMGQKYTYKYINLAIKFILYL